MAECQCGETSGGKAGAAGQFLANYPNGVGIG